MSVVKPAGGSYSALAYGAVASLASSSMPTVGRAGVIDTRNIKATGGAGTCASCPSCDCGAVSVQISPEAREEGAKRTALRELAIAEPGLGPIDAALRVEGRDARVEPLEGAEPNTPKEPARGGETPAGETPAEPSVAGAQGAPEAEGKGPDKAGPTELSAEELGAVAQLRARDTAVRAHEAAHKAAGGGSTGAVSFSYQVGPDGQRYAVGGEVSVSMSGGGSPEEVIRKAEQVRAAALAPADPSGQDRAVAAAASAVAAQARAELARSRADEAAGKGEDGRPVDKDEATKTPDNRATTEAVHEAPGLSGFSDGSAGEAQLRLPELDRAYDEALAA